MYDVNISGPGFACDEAKNRSNRRKHGVSFEEAVEAFRDENAVRYGDPDHSQDEERFILLGMSRKLRLLVVRHCLRDEGETIRLISARRATRREASAYGS